MTVGRLSVICWTVFVVMCVAFLPAIRGIYAIPGLPDGVRPGLAIFVVVVVWWGPFGYAMYLSQVGMGKNDSQLLSRGIPGTAVVLAAKRTNVMINNGGYEWQGDQVYRYRLRVTVPGWEPYETSCTITATGIGEGDTVPVAVARHNRSRVTIDVKRYRAEHGRTGGHPNVGLRFGIAQPPPHIVDLHTVDIPAVDINAADDHIVEDRIPESADTARLQQLVELARLHKEGSLTDAEFAAEKARLLGS